MVHQYRPRRKLPFELWSGHPHPLFLPEGWPCTCCPPLVRLRINPPRSLTWLTGNTEHLTCVLPEADPVKMSGEDVELPIASLVGLKRRVHHRHRITPPSPVFIGQVPPFYPQLAPLPSPSLKHRRLGVKKNGHFKLNVYSCSPYLARTFGLLYRHMRIWTLM